MAAIVPSGARRLSGSALLQLPPAAGFLIQRTLASGPFLARSMSTAKQRARRAAPESLSQALDEIQAKKEQLYDLIAKSEAPDRQNRLLLRLLSTQIKPRPNDRKWLKTQLLEEYAEMIKSSIPLSGSLLAGLALLELHSFKKAGIKRKQQQVDAAAKEEKLAHA